MGQKEVLELAIVAEANDDKCNTSVTSHSSQHSLDKESNILVCRVCYSAEPDLRGDAALSFLNILRPSNEITSSSDVETGQCQQQDTLIDLGCCCKNELALAHYACALKWFISHGSTTCEICGSVAKNVKLEDYYKIIGYMKTGTEKQRLDEASLWFGTRNNVVTVSRVNVEAENAVIMENPTAKWAIEGTGILVATGLLTVTIAWLIAPHVGKTTSRNGLHILLGGVCSLVIVIFLRFAVLSRIKYGPTRYWAVLFVFWFLVFGIWASRSRIHHQ